MRPEILYPLFVPVLDLQGVGARTGGLIEKLAGGRVVDLLWHLPAGLIDRRYAPTIAEALPGRIATMTVHVDHHRPGAKPKLPYKVICSDGTGTMELIFFHAHRDFLEKQLPVGGTCVVSGKLDSFNATLQMMHPDHIGTPDEIEALKTVEPVYPLTTGLTPKVLGKAIRGALERTTELPDWIDGPYRVRNQWSDWLSALQAAHAPGDEADLSPDNPNRMRLAYDELLANQLALAMVRRTIRKASGRALCGDGHLRAKVKAALPFELTPSQKVATAEIVDDLESNARMLRLLHGDVGSGKTVVALLAMMAAVEAGTQAAIMAPTEILARQHLATIAPLCEAAGIKAVLLTGREKGKGRDAILSDLADGTIAVAVGTHALFQDDVIFHDLGFAVIDEQHRFGVHQRLTLAAKGRATDILVMTATPIPRTLMLTAYGDMESSKLTDKPAGRPPITTRILPLDRLGEVAGALQRTIGEGAKVYWVCPLVEESEVSDLAAAEDRYLDLAQTYGARVGLVHGRMKGAEKDAAMDSFANGSVDILVATTVIEVGVDVSDAAVMVIEHAERFGLAQLHQLRGRVGRGSRESSCLLLYAAPLSETARARLKVMRETDDGFRIAEEDLRLRGAGELLGTRQSGMPVFRLADLAVHGELLATARDDVKLILERDPELQSERGKALRVLLYLFERDAAVRLLRSG